MSVFSGVQPHLAVDVTDTSSVDLEVRRSFFGACLAALGKSRAPVAGLIISLALFPEFAHSQQSIAPQQWGYADSGNSESGCGSDSYHTNYYADPFIAAAAATCVITYIRCKYAEPGAVCNNSSYRVGTWNARFANLILYVDGAPADPTLRSGIYTIYQDLTCPPGYSLSSSDYRCYPNDELTPDNNRGKSCPTGGTNPINLGNGNKFQEETDFEADGSVLKFHRFYNSSSPGFIGPFPNLRVPPRVGERWSHTYSATVALNISVRSAEGGGSPTAAISGYGAKAGTVVYITPDISTAVVIRPEGRSVYFTQVEGTNSWVADLDIQDRLVRTLDASGVPTGWLYSRCGEAVVERFDADGKLVSITEANGATTQLFYSDETTPVSIAPVPGLLIRVVDSYGRALVLQYDSVMRLSQLTAPGGRVFQYSYDGSGTLAGNLIKVVFPDGSARDYLYEDPISPHGLTGIIDENANRSSPTYRTDPGTPRFATFAYDASGRAILSEHSGGAERNSIEYRTDASSVVTDSLQTSRAFYFAKVLGVARNTGLNTPCFTCNEKLAASNTLDSQGNTTSSTDFNGVKTCSQYDLGRNLETARVEGMSTALDCASALAGNGGQPPVRRITREWHPNWKLPKRTAEPLRITTYSYNGDNGIWCAPSGASTTLVCSKSIQATTDANGFQAFSATADGEPRLWSYTYNALGRPLTVDGPRTDVSDITTFTYYSADDPSGNWKAGDLATIVNAKGQATQIVQYDAAGRTRKLVDPNGLETILEYWPRGWLKSRQTGSPGTHYETTTYGYDGVGQLTSVTMPDASFVTYEYDAAHRLTDIRDGLGNRIRYTLDAMGNRTSENAFDTTGALVRAHGRVINSLGLLFKDIGGTNPATQITQNGYDNNGNLTSILDPLGRTTTRDYDALNRITAVKDPFNGASSPTRYEYDGQDQLAKVTDPSGLATTYSVNGHGEMLSQVSPDTGNTVFTYDPASNLKTKVDARGVQTTYTYDQLNRLAQVAYPDETVTYAYDSCANGIGRLCKIADKTGTTSYAYDLWGRVTSKTQTVGTLTQSMSYGYNTAGQLISVMTPSGRQVAYTYLNNRPVSVSINGEKVLDSVYYEPFGPNGGWRWGNSTTAVLNTHTRVFDKDFRATRITSDLPASGNQPYFDRKVNWDDQGRVGSITDLSNSALSATYGYDLLDRITSASQGGTNWGYSFNGTGDRLTSNVNSSSTNYGYSPGTHRLQNLAGAQAKTYTYDAAGNLVSDGTVAWTYGGNNRPTQAGSTAFLINALGQRVKKSGASGATRFVYDEAGRLWGEYDDSGNLRAETIWLDDLPVAVVK